MFVTESTPASYCASLLREHAYARYLIVLFMPREKRDGALALLALNHELRRIPSHVSEPMLGHIRFSWWREAVEELFTGKAPRAHPVLEALKPVVTSGIIPQADFIRLVDEEEEAFAGGQLPTEDILLPLLTAWAGEGKWRRAYALGASVPAMLTPWQKVKTVIRMWGW